MTEKTFATLFSAGDTVYLDSMFDNLYNDNYYTMYFTGFLYEPLNSHRVIWAVCTTSSLSCQYSPFPFNVVSINVGNGWNKTTNRFVVPYAGVYQLHLTATAYYYTPIEYTLMWNNVAFISILSATTSYNGIITRSKAVMIKASVGDTFYIATSSSTYLVSYYCETSLTGYLVVT